MPSWSCSQLSGEGDASLSSPPGLMVMASLSDWREGEASAASLSRPTSPKGGRGESVGERAERHRVTHVYAAGTRSNSLRRRPAEADRPMLEVRRRG